MCGDDATWTPLAPGGGNAMPSCIRKIQLQYPLICLTLAFGPSGKGMDHRFPVFQALKQYKFLAYYL